MPKTKGAWIPLSFIFFTIAPNNIITHLQYLNSYRVIIQLTIPLLQTKTEFRQQPLPQIFQFFRLTIANPFSLGSPCQTIYFDHQY